MDSEMRPPTLSISGSHMAWQARQKSVPPGIGILAGNNKHALWDWINAFLSKETKHYYSNAWMYGAYMRVLLVTSLTILKLQIQYCVHSPFVWEWGMKPGQRAIIVLNLVRAARITLPLNVGKFLAGSLLDTKHSCSSVNSLSFCNMILSKWTN